MVRATCKPWYNGLNPPEHAPEPPPVQEDDIPHPEGSEDFPTGPLLTLVAASLFVGSGFIFGAGFWLAYLAVSYFHPLNL